MLVLVTGSAGFVGSHIVAALLREGHRVRGLDLRPSSGGTVGDVRDPAAVARCLDGVDAVCHQAAKVGLGVDVFDLPGYAGVNALGTAVLLAEMARAGVDRLVLASSMVVYGEGAYECPEHGRVRPGPRSTHDLEKGIFEPPCPRCGGALRPGLVGEPATFDPRNVYADTKVAQEHLAASWARTTGGRAIALRYHNVYGPRMPRDTPYAGVAAIFRSRLARGLPPQVYEDGGQRRDFVHVRDVARANVRALEATEQRPPHTVRAYNVASGEPHTVGEMAAALAEAYGGPEPEVTGAFRLGDVRHIVASSSRAAAELGFAARISLAEGMAEFAQNPEGAPTPPAESTAEFAKNPDSALNPPAEATAEFAEKPIGSPGPPPESTAELAQDPEGALNPSAEGAAEFAERPDGALSPPGEGVPRSGSRARS